MDPAVTSETMAAHQAAQATGAPGAPPLENGVQPTSRLPRGQGVQQKLTTTTTTAVMRPVNSSNEVRDEI